jgi:hypothetical protein
MCELEFPELRDQADIREPGTLHRGYSENQNGYRDATAKHSVSVPSAFLGFLCEMFRFL